MSFLDEIRRRKVMRVAAVYAASAFVVLQAADLILPRLGVPEAAMTLVVVLALLGFPIALVLAWVLEVTPEGVRMTTSHAPDSGTPPPSLLGRRTLVATAVLIALGSGFALGTGALRAPDGAAAGDVHARDVAADRSIAVLPFADFSPSGDQRWFSDGLAEEILNALARLPDLRVASRTGSFRFRDRGTDIRAIADSLDVAYVLEGSVRRDGEEIRITAQLIRAGDDAHVWSQNFDRPAIDVIRVQEEIAAEIARTLRTALDPDELARMVATGTNSIAAYESLLRARHLEARAIELEDWQLLLEHLAALQRAREIDPQFHRAHLAEAAFWMDQMDPSRRVYGITALDYDARMSNALARLRAAEASAPDRLTRLMVERTRAQLELRLRDALELSEQIVQLHPTAQEWVELGVTAIMIGRYDRAGEALRLAATQPGEVDGGYNRVAENLQRVDPAAAFDLARKRLGTSSLNEIYQLHRIALAAGRLDAASDLATRYLARSSQTVGRTMLRIRQLCGEGQTAAARALYDSVSSGMQADAWFHWQALHYAGRHAEAAEMLRPLDNAGELYALGSFLRYPFFDPAPYPRLAAVLRRNDALRTQQLQPAYACPPDTE